MERDGPAGNSSPRQPFGRASGVPRLSLESLGNACNSRLPLTSPPQPVGRQQVAPLGTRQSRIPTPQSARDVALDLTGGARPSLKLPLTARGTPPATFPKLDAKEGTPRWQRHTSDSAGGTHSLPARGKATIPAGRAGPSPLPTPRSSYKDALVTTRSLQQAGQHGTSPPPTTASSRRPSPLPLSLPRTAGTASPSSLQLHTTHVELAEHSEPRTVQNPDSSSGADNHHSRSSGTACTASAHASQVTSASAACEQQQQGQGPLPGAPEPDNCSVAQEDAGTEAAAAAALGQQLQRVEYEEEHVQQQIARLQSSLALQHAQLHARLAAVQVLSEQRDALAEQVAEAQRVCMQAQQMADARSAELQQLGLLGQAMAASLGQLTLQHPPAISQQASARCTLLNLMLTAARALHTPLVASAIQQALTAAPVALPAATITALASPPASEWNTHSSTSCSSSALAAPALPLGLGEGATAAPGLFDAAGCGTEVFNTPAGSIAGFSSCTGSSSSGGSSCTGSDTDVSDDSCSSSSCGDGEITARVEEEGSHDVVCGNPDRRDGAASPTVALQARAVPPLQLPALVAAAGSALHASKHALPGACGAPVLPACAMPAAGGLGRKPLGLTISLSSEVLLPSSTGAAGQGAAETLGNGPRSPLSPLALQRLQSIGRKIAAAEHILAAVVDQNVQL